MNMRNIKKINLDNLVQILLYTAISLIIINLLASGNMQNYIHKRLNPYLWATAVLLLLMVPFIAKNLFKPKRNFYIGRYILLFIPIIAFFIFSPLMPIDNNSLTIEYGQSYELSEIEDNYKYSETVEFISPENYLEWYYDVLYNMAQHNGNRVKFLAQVKRLDSLSENEFLPIRSLMWCCTADISQIGFICRYENALDLENNIWIYVTAEIRFELYNEKIIPVLYAENIENTQQPDEIYIY